MSVQLVHVNFHDDELEAIQAADRKVWVNVRRLCEVLGLDPEGQRQRLTDPSRSPWATTCVMKAVAQDGKTRDVTAIDLDSLPMWLATIEVGRVRDESRSKIVRYQRECARVLRDHFFGPTTSGDALLDSIHTIHRTVGALVEVRQRQLATEREVAEVRGIAEAADAKADNATALATAALQTVEAGHGYFTVIAYARRTGREMSLQQAQAHGRHLTRHCARDGIHVEQVPDQRWGNVNAYPESVLEDYFDNLDD